MAIEEFDLILREIENKSITHPNLSRLWREYLKIKKQKLDTAMIEAKNALTHIETMDDMPWDMILCLSSVSETLRENTT
ncbi:MAG: hypothetical protein WD512_20115 [Candidatus Paceibacterota bacterium]